MKIKLLIFVLLLLFSTEVFAAPPSPWLPCSDGDGYCIDVDLDGVSDFRINSSGSMSYIGTKGDASFGTVTADEVNAGSVTMGSALSTTNTSDTWDIKATDSSGEEVVGVRFVFTRVDGDNCKLEIYTRQSGTLTKDAEYPVP